MTISEAQLEVWANQGAVVLSKQTHESIRLALAADSSLIKGKDYEIYLQGSYRNTTNIRGDSDVDIVVELKSTFAPDTSLLSAFEKKFINLPILILPATNGKILKQILYSL